MATFSMSAEHEVRETIDSPTLQAIKALSNADSFKAFSIKYRHPRFKSKFTSPSFCVSFQVAGKRYSESEDSLEALDKVLYDCYLSPTAAPFPS